MLQQLVRCAQAGADKEIGRTYSRAHWRKEFSLSELVGAQKLACVLVQQYQELEDAEMEKLLHGCIHTLVRRAEKRKRCESTSDGRPDFVKWLKIRVNATASSDDDKKEKAQECPVTMNEGGFVGHDDSGKEYTMDEIMERMTDAPWPIRLSLKKQMRCASAENEEDKYEKRKDFARLRESVEESVHSSDESDESSKVSVCTPTGFE